MGCTTPDLTGRKGGGKVRDMDFQELKITAQLAQLEVTEDDAERLGEEINQILSYFEKMNEIDVSGLEPTTRVLLKENRLRDDSAADSDLSDDILENAPETSDRFITIPRIL
jgi:aspartyl-tRNA(Asn)/glutamyl-tRNA(Gln) amidotransferase subunit C